MAGRTPGKDPKSREDRLKAALKANMARRKAQMRARGSVDRVARGADTGAEGTRAADTRAADTPAAGEAGRDEDDG